MGIRFLALGLLLAASALAQFDPEDAEVISYYPHVADGGPVGQNWITAFRFANPHPTSFASGTAYFYDNSGRPLSLDFGNGPVSSVYFAAPPQGTAEFKTIGAPPVLVTGWAMVVSTLPVQGMVRLRFSVNGVPQQGASEQTTRASSLFRSPATVSTGVAIANVSLNAMTINVSALDFNGKALANSSVTLNSLGHAAFTVGQFFPGLPPSFSGSVLISPATPGTYCVAWTLSDDLGVLAGDPSAGLNWPVSQNERLMKVWKKLVSIAAVDYPLPVLPKLVVDPDNRVINAFAKASTNEVDIFLNLVELMSDSDSELSFVIGHELGHLLQSKLGRVFQPANKETDADEWAIVLSLQAGYDPYAAAGALGKLSMVSGTPGLMDPDFDNLQSVIGLNIHGSFNDRLAFVFDGILSICEGSQYQGLCNNYKTTVHSHVPSPLPLGVPGKGSAP
jgi:hypothetical protein